MNNPFPSRSTAFHAFAHQAEPYQQLWRTILGLLVIAVLYATPIVLIVIYLIFLSGPGGANFLARVQAEGTALSTLALFVVPVFSYPAIWFALRFIHHRPVASLFGIGNRIVWRHFRNAALITGLLASIGFMLSIFGGAVSENLALQKWLILLPVVVILLFLQIASEELIFRAYLMQQLGARFVSRWVWFVLPAFLFSLLHWDAATFQSNAPLVVVGAFLIGLFAGDLTARTGNLGAAMGLHFANNFFAVLIMGLPGPASGLALYVANVDLNDIQAVRGGLIGQIISILVVYLIYLAIVARRRTGQLQSQGADFN